MANESWLGHSTQGLIGSGFFYMGLHGGSEERGTEIQASTYSAAGTYSKSAFYVSLNTAGNTATLRFRVNGANGNQVATCGAGLTGWFQDTTHSDTCANGDLVNWFLTSGSSITYRGCYTCQFIPTTGNCVAYYGVGSTTGGNVATGGNLFHWMSGLSGPFNTTEPDTKGKVRAPGTLSHLSMFPVSQAQMPTVWPRINGSSGTLTLVENTASGRQTDTTHTDSLSAGDTLSYMSFRTPGNDRSVYSLHFRFTSSGTTHDIFTGTKNGTNMGLATDLYQTLFGTTVGGVYATESDAQTKAPFAAKFTNLRVNVGSGSTITGSGNVTMGIRVNGSTGALACVIPGGGSGFFEDTTNNVVCAADDLVNYRSHPSGSVSGSVQTVLAVTVDNVAAAPTLITSTIGTTLRGISQIINGNPIRTAVIGTTLRGVSQTIIAFPTTASGAGRRSFWTT